MKKLPLGKTGLTVSTLALGGAAFGQQYGPVTPQEVAETVQVAREAGINLIDTSAYYGQGISEQLLGQALANCQSSEMLICTKAGRLGAQHFDFRPQGMRECLEGSLRRLQRDHVDILLAHDIEFAEDLNRVFHETYDILLQLKREGKCRFIGMSAYPLAVLRQAIERCDLDVVISYCHGNLQNNQIVTDLLPLAEKRGVGVLNASPLAMGLLTQAGPPAWHPAGAEIKQACRLAADLCQSRGADLALLGMQYVLNDPRLPCTITGAARATELAVNLRALKDPVDKELLAEVEALLSPIHNQTWPSGYAAR